MKLHNTLKNEDCIGQKVTADIPVGHEWVDYPDNYIGGVITPDEVEPHEPNNEYRDVYVEDGLLAFCQGETCEIKNYNEEAGIVTLLNNDPNRCLSTGGHNATEFTIPYEWYTACFGTGWPFEELAWRSAQQVREVEKPSVLDAIRADRQRPRLSSDKAEKVKKQGYEEL